MGLYFLTTKDKKKPAGNVVEETKMLGLLDSLIYSKYV